MLRSVSATDLEPAGGEPSEEVESASLRRTAVYKHPQRARIEALLRRGKSAWWIASWLEEMYPLEDEDEEPHPDAALHIRWRISEETLEAYRARFMPEFAPGVDVVDDELEELIGRKFPTDQHGPQAEIELLEVGVRVAQKNLARALASDEELQMVQPTTLDAHRAFMDTVRISAEVKQKLGVKGYEPLPEQHIVHQTTRNVSLELHGRIDERTGQVGPADQRKVDLMRDALDAPPERLREILAAMKSPAELPPSGDVIEGEETPHAAGDDPSA
jgi:hypothetical protein